MKQGGTVLFDTRDAVMAPPGPGGENRSPGMLALHIAFDRVEVPVRVRVWDDEVAAYDMGDIAAQWFSDFLGRRLRLVRFDPEHRRLSNLQWTGGVEAVNQFSDCLFVQECFFHRVNLSICYDYSVI